MNLLEKITPSLLTRRALHWDNPPKQWEALPGGGMRIYAPARADYFRNPTGEHVNDSAPLLWKNVTGNFVAQALVRPTFSTTYDSGVLMMRDDELTWAKLCYEKTDFGTTAAVSVVTNGYSDDANGEELSFPQLWLQMVRVGNVFALHYSSNGETWRMVRVFRLEVPPTVKVGIAAQSPVGPGTTIDFLHFGIEERTVENLRAGL